MNGEIKGNGGTATFKEYVDHAMAYEYLKKATVYPDANSAWAYLNLMKYFHKDYDEEANKQFVAVTFVLPDDTGFISYRGTDLSMMGWREDLYIAFRDHVPGATDATEYLEKAVKKFKGNFYAGGHSKGGNLAIYATLHMEPELSERLLYVYSFDGPGFRIKGLFKVKEDRLEKFTKIVPQSSIVGVLFSNETDVKIIKSCAVMFLQHNPFEWVIKDNDFVYLTKRTLSSRHLEKALNAWIESLNPEDRERFTEIIFGELEKFEADDFVVFFKKILLQIGPVYKAYRGLNKDDKKLVYRVMKKLVRNMIKPEKKKLIA